MIVNAGAEATIRILGADTSRHYGDSITHYGDRHYGDRIRNRQFRDPRSAPDFLDQSRSAPSVARQAVDLMEA
jgi:hypothetical protein